MGHTRPHEKLGKPQCGLCGHNSRGCKVFMKGKKINVRCFGGEQPGNTAKYNKLKNFPLKCDHCTNMYWKLSEKEHYANSHSGLDPPTGNKDLVDEFIDTYVEHKNKKFRNATVKRTKPKKKPRVKKKRKRQPKREPSVQINTLVPPPINFPKPKRLKPEPVVKVEEF